MLLSGHRFALCGRVKPAVKAPTYQPSKPIGEVLKECRPGAEWEEKRVVWSKLIFDAGISNAKDWLELPDDRKKKIEDEGLPYAVINALDYDVRQGLLLPQFKYYDEVKFMEEPPFANDEVGEAKTILQLARQVDDGWVLTRKECDVLCLLYQRMTEKILQLTVEHFNEKKDSFFLNNPSAWRSVHTVGLDGGQPPFQFLKRYPPIHSLTERYRLVRRQTKFPADSSTDDDTMQKHLFRISRCAGTRINTTKKGGTISTKVFSETRISCRDFWDSAQIVDQLVVPLLRWIDMKKEQFTTAEPVQPPPWMKLKTGEVCEER